MTSDTHTHFSIATRLDATVRAQDDFYAHVNNTWLAAHPIPDSESRWGTFYVLRDQAWKNMHTIYKEFQNTTDAPAGSVNQQARDFYYTGMHVDDYQQVHLNIVADYLAKIDAVSTTKEFWAMLGQLHAIGAQALWSVIIDGDDKDSTKHLFRLHQGGLTLPDRGYYLSDDKKMVDVRDAYTTFMATVHRHFTHIAGSTQALQSVIMRLESDLARISRTRSDLRDVENNYHKTAFADLVKTYPAIDWQTYAQNMGWRPADNISVDQPEFFAFVNKHVSQATLNDWKTYLKWQYLMTYMGRISESYATMKFTFFGKILYGTKEILPLWKRVVVTMDDLVGDATGQLYAQKHFPESSKQQVLDMVEDIRAVYKDRIQALDWMAADTKTYAIKKLQNITVLIGYPDKWRDFSGLHIGRESYMHNIMAAEKFQNDYYLRRLHEPVSRDDWFMCPQTVNAYHDPGRLVICFPAAILQAPFFDPQATAAQNMGGIGTVIGHELTHGFDDQGCLFDAQGNVRQWQTDADRKAFNKRAKVLSDQADKFQVLPGVYMKGSLVIGESIADLGGVEIAYQALQNKPASARPDIGGLTADQQFFINYASTECGHTRDETARQYALIDPHPHERFRVNGILKNIDAFYAAFNVQLADKLFLPSDQRARVW